MSTITVLMFVCTNIVLVLLIAYSLLSKFASLQWLATQTVFSNPSNHVSLCCCRYPSLTGGCKMNWNFFGSGHGKGEWDGAGAVVKRTLRTEQLLNPQRTLQNARDCVTFLEATLGGEVANSRDSLRYSTFTEDRCLFHSTH